MSWNAQPIRPKHPEITQASDRRLANAIKLHYQICRHLDEQVDGGYREIMGERHFSQTTLDRLTTERNEAHEILRLYLAEAVRRRKQEHLDQKAMPTH